MSPSATAKGRVILSTWPFRRDALGRWPVSRQGALVRVDQRLVPREAVSERLEQSIADHGRALYGDAARRR